MGIRGMKRILCPVCLCSFLFLAVSWLVSHWCATVPSQEFLLTLTRLSTLPIFCVIHCWYLHTFFCLLTPWYSGRISLAHHCHYGPESQCCSGYFSAHPVFSPGNIATAWPVFLYPLFWACTSLTATHSDVWVGHRQHSVSGYKLVASIVWKILWTSPQPICILCVVCLTFPTLLCVVIFF